MSLFDFRRLIEFNVSGKYDPRSVLCLADQSQIVVGTFDGRLELYAPSDSEQVRSRIIKETCDSNPPRNLFSEIQFDHLT